MPAAEAPESRVPARIPGGVWALGFVSLFMDVSSEMIHALLPVFLVGTLGATATAVAFVGFRCVYPASADTARPPH